MDFQPKILMKTANKEKITVSFPVSVSENTLKALRSMIDSNVDVHGMTREFFDHIIKMDREKSG